MSVDEARDTVAIPHVSRFGRENEMAVPSTPQYIFVIGTGRCGSTLTEEILCRHPEVGFISNLDDRLHLPISATGSTAGFTAGFPPRSRTTGL